SSRATVSAMMVEGLIKEISDELLRINQDCLNTYSISIAKKARSANKKRSKSQESQFEENKELLQKKMDEIEGFQAQIRSIEKKNKILDEEKEEMLKHFSEMNSRISELENLLSTSKEDFDYQINALNAEWEAKFKQNQEEWDSYVKLKLAEKEVRSADELVEPTQPTEPEPEPEMDGETKIEE
ncbi:MAG: hypothetical protein ACXACU_14595, partial [Candidatus Hodarchaeales archaeon]